MLVFPFVPGPVRENENIKKVSKNWILSSTHVERRHLMILIPMLIVWYSWLVRNEAKFHASPIKVEVIIGKIMKFITDAHFAKAYKIKMWIGDLQVAHLWNINLLDLIHPESFKWLGTNLLKTGWRWIVMELLFRVLNWQQQVGLSKIVMDESCRVTKHTLDQHQSYTQSSMESRGSGHLC